MHTPPSLGYSYPSSLGCSICELNEIIILSMLFIINIMYFQKFQEKAEKYFYSASTSAAFLQEAAISGVTS